MIWDIFSEDSILAANQESDKSLYYKRLAARSSEASRRFFRNLRCEPFGALTDASEDWAFDACEENAPLVEIIRSVTRS